MATDTTDAVRAVTTEHDAAPTLSDEARRLIERVIDDALDGPGGRHPTGKTALTVYVARLEAEAARLRDVGQKQAADFHAAFYILNQDIGFVGSHWESFPDPSAGYWPNLCVHVSSFGADAEEVPREHWQMLAEMTKKHGDHTGEAYACWRRGTDKPEKGNLSAAAQLALAEFRAAALAAQERPHVQP